MGIGMELNRQLQQCLHDLGYISSAEQKRQQRQREREGERDRQRNRSRKKSGIRLPDTYL